LRKLVWITCAAALLALAGLARAQELDIAVNGSALFSPRNTSASLAFLPPAEEGTLFGASVQYIGDNHFGYSAEGAFRYHEGLYNGFQHFRPILYDVNGVYSRHLHAKIEGDLMAGIGGQTLIFYNSFSNSCVSSVCPISVNSTHFLVHLGGGIRYNFWHSLFIRPEANYYRVIDNHEFNSGNVLRLGASIGFSIK